MPYAPELFNHRPRGAQIASGVVAPAVLGAAAGILIGATSVGYWVLAVLAAMGAFIGGFEHPNARSGALRGLVGGTIYGGFLLLAHAIAGTEEKVSLGDAPALLIVVTAIIGAVLSAAGAAIRSRHDRRAPAA
jgi:hypothetical protein